MKRAITILLALLMVLSLAGCGGGNKDKDKLIGVWSKSTPFTKTYNPGTNSYVSVESEEKYSFFENNEFYREWYGATSLVGSKTPKKDWTKRIYHGTYALKDGKIVFKYDNDESIDSMLKEPVPYYINEYTKDLIFDVDEKGESDWTHSSNNPRVLTAD